MARKVIDAAADDLVDALTAGATSTAATATATLYLELQNPAPDTSLVDGDNLQQWIENALIPAVVSPIATELLAIVAFTADARDVPIVSQLRRLRALAPAAQATLVGKVLGLAPSLLLAEERPNAADQPISPPFWRDASLILATLPHQLTPDAQLRTLRATIAAIVTTQPDDALR